MGFKLYSALFLILANLLIITAIVLEMVFKVDTGVFPLVALITTLVALAVSYAPDFIKHLKTEREAINEIPMNLLDSDWGGELNG